MEELIVCSALIWGIKCIFARGFIFEKGGEWLTFHATTLSTWMINCPPCMSSLYGTIYYFSFVSTVIWQWPIFVLSVTGINYLLSHAINFQKED